MRISNNPRDGQYPFNVHAHVDKRLWEALLKIVSIQGTSKAVELRQALREYVANRQWMLKGD